MFEKDTIAVDIGSSFIKVMVGNKKEVKFCELIKTPDGTVVDDRILNVDALVSLLKEFLSLKNIRGKEISYAIHGQDVVIRHIELPIMDKKDIRNSVEWEINQYLPESGALHYVDFEIIEKVDSKDKKIYKILAVAVPRDKVDKYVKLTKELNLKLRAIDVSASCVARMYKDLTSKDIESIGVIDVGNKNSSIIILDHGKLFMEREVPFGVDNVLREVARKMQVNNEEAQYYLNNDFDFTKIYEEDEVQKRVQTLFDNVFSTFAKVIQFYSTGKVNKNLDAIYVTGVRCNISGIDKYIENYFSTKVHLIDSPRKINLKIKLPRKCDLRYYANVFGLLLRKE